MLNTVSSVVKHSDKKLISLAGPTAVGKTGLAIKLAQALGSEIISFDSRQFYRELRIGSAAPSKEELATVPHHFILDRSVKEELNAAAFAEEALTRIESLFQRSDYVVLVGGSGLYLKAILEGFDEIPEIPTQFREDLKLEHQSAGLAPLQKELAEKDPDFFQIVDRNNPQRLIRALEVIRATGKAYSSFRRAKKRELPYQITQLALTEERATLYDRINQRVDQMIADGLQEEAYGLREEQERSSLQTVGYKEFFAYFKGDYDLEHCISEIKKNSRRYAKRQFTWFRREPALHWFQRDQLDDILKLIHAQ